MSKKEDVNDKFLTLECKKCLKKIHFRISADTIAENKFPLKLEDIHGKPPHHVIFKINKNFEVESFEIEEALAKKKTITSKFTREILKEYGLEDKEIDLLIMCLGLGPVTVGEMSRLVNLPAENIEKIAKKFVEKGFFKEIVGARQYYQALPPYPALIEQLNDFGQFISKIKKETPIKLQDSFKQFEAQAEGVKKLNDFVDYLSNLSKSIEDKIQTEKSNLDQTLSMLDQRENIKAIESLQEQAIGVIERQFTNLNQKMVESISKFDDVFINMEKNLDNSVQRFDKRIDQITESLNNLKIKLTKNFAKLRLGIIQKVVEDVLNKTFLAEMIKIKSNFKNDLNRELNNLIDSMKKSFLKELKEPLENIINTSQEYFEKELKENFKNLILDVSQKLKDSTKNVTKIGDDLKGTFNKIVEEFNNTIQSAQNRITGISDEVLNSFASLRETFSQTVISELEDMLGKVKTRLDLSSLTVEEFWEDAKALEALSMKDVWFIRTPEGMRSQINEEILSAKMRVLIVTPTLTDLEIEPILSVKSNINIRICCTIDPNNAEHKEILEKLEKKTNISLRHRTLQNLWGINRDYEEIILGIVSKSEVSEEIELVGLGSNLEEHIKILVPILEEAWMGSKKDYYVTAPTLPTKPSKKISKPQIEAQPQKPAKIETTITTSATTSKQPSISSIKPKVSDSVITKIIEKIENLKQLINEEDGQTFSKHLIELRDYIFENKGFSKILNDIKNWATQVKTKSVIDDNTKKMILKRIDYWKESVSK
ncbi:MAG: helix-turn-helix domain-containing protein [Promethearchaeota archaeon]